MLIEQILSGPLRDKTRSDFVLQMHQARFLNERLLLFLVSKHRRDEDRGGRR